MNRVGQIDVVLSLVAGVERKLDAQGEYIQFVNGSGPVTVWNDRGDRITRGPGNGAPLIYEGLTVLSDTTQTVTLSVGFLGGMQPFSAQQTSIGNLNITPGVGNSLAPAADDVVPAASQKKISNASPSKLEVDFYLDETAAGWVRVGDSSVSAAIGRKVYPGDGFIFQTTGEIWVYNPNASDVIYNVLVSNL